MTRQFSCFGLAALMCMAAVSAGHRPGRHRRHLPVAQVAAVLPPDLQGVVHDDRRPARCRRNGVGARHGCGRLSSQIPAVALPSGISQRVPTWSARIVQGYLPVRAQLVQVRRAPNR